MAAPNASCTETPVNLPGATEFDPQFQVSPRRICYQAGATGRCLSGVPKPRDRQIADYSISPGSDASACAMRGDKVICWGEKYSPAGALDNPVTVALEPLPPLGDMAVLEGTDASRLKQECQINRPCAQPLRKLPRCKAGDKAHPTSEILAAASSLVGKVVRARGPLGVGALRPENIGMADILCDPAVRCCGRARAPIAVGTNDGMLALVGLNCSGDESRACCDAPAYGQIVIATGKLERVDAAQGWRLANASVCEEPR